MPTSTQTTVQVSTTGNGVIPYSPKRKALILNAPPTNRITLTQSPNAALDIGITLYPGQVPTVLTYHDVGEAVRQAFQGISAVAAQPLTYIEVFE